MKIVDLNRKASFTIKSGGGVNSPLGIVTLGEAIVEFMKAKVKRPDAELSEIGVGPIDVTTEVIKICEKWDKIFMAEK